MWVGCVQSVVFFSKVLPVLLVLHDLYFDHFLAFFFVVFDEGGGWDNIRVVV